MTITPEDLAALRYLNDIANRYCRPYLTQAPPPPASGVEQMLPARPARQEPAEESCEVGDGTEG